MFELIAGIEYKAIMFAIIVLSFWFGFPTIWQIYFGDKHGFRESLHFLFQADLWSLFKGQYYEDKWHELKLVLFALTCFGWVAAIYKLFLEVFS